VTSETSETCFLDFFFFIAMLFSSFLVELLVALELYCRYGVLRLTVIHFT